jgi:hypothetical protein
MKIADVNLFYHSSELIKELKDDSGGKNIGMLLRCRASRFPFSITNIFTLCSHCDTFSPMRHNSYRMKWSVMIYCSYSFFFVPDDV